MALGKCARLCSKYPYPHVDKYGPITTYSLNCPHYNGALTKGRRISIGAQARELAHVNRSYSDDADSWNRDTDFDRANL